MTARRHRIKPPESAGHPPDGPYTSSCRLRGGGPRHASGTRVLKSITSKWRYGWRGGSGVPRPRVQASGGAFCEDLFFPRRRCLPSDQAGATNGGCFKGRSRGSAGRRGTGIPWGRMQRGAPNPRAAACRPTRCGQTASLRVYAVGWTAGVVGARLPGRALYNGGCSQL
ncbi:hypothetical protein M885DRAFT_192966 [Pelagophyceae sp. CCMP2097]|nr:hypothetical protein M885DRAFT_192966 [Pelagophyceae sp. CCMP2097]